MWLGWSEGVEGVVRMESGCRGVWLGWSEGVTDRTLKAYLRSNMSPKLVREMVK